MALLNLSLQLMSISMVIVLRQTIHDLYADRKEWNDSYDYIVVGAGATGSVIAQRLSEKCKYRVILLEAGGPQSVFADIPKNSRSLISSEFDWMYRTVQQNWFTPYKVPLPRGKAMGGSTILSNLVYSRGNRKDFDIWVRHYGAKGWGYRDLLPYFKKSVNNTDYSLVSHYSRYHGTSGLVSVSTDKNPDPILLKLEETLKHEGIESFDINGPKQCGTTIAQSYIANGLRSTSATGYLERDKPTDYLHILTKAFVTKIHFNTYGGRVTATGVQFIKNGIYHSVSAKKEVIICAGAYSSPQLLMLSGIGPKDHLNQLGIPVVADLPVGNNLQDHPAISIHMLIKDDKLVRPGAQSNIEQLYKVLVEKTGPLSVLTSSILFYSTSAARSEDPKWANTYTLSSVEFINDLNVTIREIPAQKQQWISYFRPHLNRYVLHLSPHLSRIRSYGTLRLSSANPFAYPIIDPRFLAHHQDYKDLLELTKFIIYVLTETQLSEHLSVFRDPIPGCDYCVNRKLYECDPYIKCLIRETIKSGHNPVGTCRMGNIYRNDIVVDEKLRVKNVGRLRVCDTSIIPQIINANTNAIANVIGERAAELIQHDEYFTSLVQTYF